MRIYQLQADVQHGGWARRGYGSKAAMVAQARAEHARDGRAVRVVSCRDGAIVYEAAEQPEAFAAHARREA